MEESTEALMFLSDYANGKTIPKSIVLGTEAKEFCRINDEFVNKSKLDPENDDREARTGAINYMILATNVQRFKQSKAKGEVALATSDYQSSDAQALLENRYHFAKKRAAVRRMSVVLKKTDHKRIYWCILAALILLLLVLIAFFIVDSVHVPQVESKDVFGHVSDFFTYDLLGNQRPDSELAVWSRMQQGRLNLIWAVLILTLLTALAGAAHWLASRSVAKQKGICARYHLFLLYIRKLEEDRNKQEEDF